MTRYLVTGGAGFIGYNLVRELLATEPGSEVVVLDKLTYAGNARALALLADEPRFSFVRSDIADRVRVRELLCATRPDVLLHLAAESHVDRSIDAPAEFIATNIVGTFELLDECRRYLDAGAASSFRLVHVSTDEVFGSLGPTGTFSESTPYAPRSPYAASKAASDHLVSAYVHTYGFPAIITNCSNNYGPYQFPEKLVPVVISRALAGAPLPVYGDGQNVRDWIHVADHCAALRAVVARGQIGERYVIGARNERTNVDVVLSICEVLDELCPGTDPYRKLLRFVADRPGHDFRYAIDPSKIERELGWCAQVSFEAGLRRTIAWYLEQGEQACAYSSRPYR